ncbi:MAG TPA: hypothetical protein VK163_03840 [Opitutaceae bacterium]|nr:hypothetical protein [Opitutaceae bacterium]
MSSAYNKLTEELQRAVAQRTAPQSGSTQTLQQRAATYRMSDDAADYLRRLADYRARTRTVRVGQY